MIELSVFRIPLWQIPMGVLQASVLLVIPFLGFGCKGTCPTPLRSGSWNPLIYYASINVLRELRNPQSVCDIQITFPDGTGISREHGSSIAILAFKRGPAPVLATDLIYLIDSSTQSNRNFLTESTSLEQFLDGSLRAQSLGFRKTFAPNGDEWFGGNANASNSYGSDSFNYRVVEQLHSDQKAQKAMDDWRAHPEWRQLPDPLSKIDPAIQGQFDPRFGVVRGLECHAATAMHLFKALGLVRPDLDRPGLEHSYTELHHSTKMKGILPARFNRTLQGYYDSPVTAGMIAEMANILSNSSWATLTGASLKHYYPYNISTLADIQRETSQQNVIYVWLSPKGGFAGHSYLITNATGTALRADESFAWQPAKRVDWIAGGYSSMIVLRASK